MTKFKLHHVPIYDLRFFFCVTDNEKELVNKLGPHFLNIEHLKELNGLALHDGSNFAVLLNTWDLCHELISHEIFHTTARMMEFCAHQLDKNCHEPHAYLNGFLTQLAYSDLKKWGVKVNTTTKFSLNRKKYFKK